MDIRPGFAGATLDRADHLRLDDAALAAARRDPAALLFLGFSSFTDTLEGLLPMALADALSNFSFITHFDAFTKGIIDPKDVIFFLSLMGFTLFLNVVVLER